MRRGISGFAMSYVHICFDAYMLMLAKEEMREVINGLLRKAGAAIADGKQVLDLEAPLDLSTMFLDTTCVKLTFIFLLIGCFCATASRA
jgi:hypothetical protein